MTNTYDAALYDLQHGSALVRALSSMRPADAGAINQAVAAFGNRWVANAHDDYDGYLSILIEPAGADYDRPSYYVSTVAGQIEIAEFRDDTITTIAAFNAIAPAFNRVSTLLAE